MSDPRIHCYTEDIKIANEKIAAAKSSDVGYIFVADLHNGAYLLKDEEGHLTFYEDDDVVALKEARLIAQLDAIAEIAKNNDSIDFICVGGDIINGYETCDGAREKAAGQITRQLDALVKSGKKVFVLMGNHDDGTFHRIFYPWGGDIHKEIAFSDKYWNDKFLAPYIPENCVHDSTYNLSKYYYYDLEKNGKSIRIVCLDNFDVRMPFDEEGNVTEWIKANVHYGYSAAQLKWLATEALPPEYEGEAMILCHMGVTSTDNGWETPRGDKLYALLSAYQNKTAFADDELGVSIDYKDSKGKILNYHFGHIHRNKIYYGEELKLWQISTDTAEHNPCFDIMLVSSDRIQRFNVGNGEDAEVEIK